MQIFEITDDSGFIGIANYHRYQSFLSEDWDFEMIRKKIIDAINSHQMLFWATGYENTWKVNIVEESSKKIAYQEARGVIEVTDGKLYLTNYESLTMAAQFSKIQLPEQHHQHLFIAIENGKYMVKFRQLFNPELFNASSKEIHFEIVIQKIMSMPEIYNNNVDEIYWYKR